MNEYRFGGSPRDGQQQRPHAPTPEELPPLLPPDLPRLFIIRHHLDQQLTRAETVVTWLHVLTQHVDAAISKARPPQTREELRYRLQARHRAEGTTLHLADWCWITAGEVVARTDVLDMLDDPRSRAALTMCESCRPQDTLDHAPTPDDSHP